MMEDLIKTRYDVDELISQINRNKAEVEDLKERIWKLEEQNEKMEKSVKFVLDVIERVNDIPIIIPEYYQHFDILKEYDIKVSEVCLEISAIGTAKVYVDDECDATIDWKTLDLGDFDDEIYTSVGETEHRRIEGSDDKSVGSVTYVKPILNPEKYVEVDDNEELICGERQCADVICTIPCVIAYNPKSISSYPNFQATKAIIDGNRKSFIKSSDD